VNKNYADFSGFEKFISNIDNIDAVVFRYFDAEMLSVIP
jgi:hypothetical protein